MEQLPQLGRRPPGRWIAGRSGIFRIRSIRHSQRRLIDRWLFSTIRRFSSRRGRPLRLANRPENEKVATYCRLTHVKLHLLVHLTVHTEGHSASPDSRIGLRFTDLKVVHDLFNAVDPAG